MSPEGMAPSTTRTRRGTRAGWRSRIFGWALRGREELPPGGTQWPIGSAGPLAGGTQIRMSEMPPRRLLGCRQKKKGAIGIKWSKEVVRSESGGDGGDTPRYYAQWLPRYGDSARLSLTSINTGTTELWLAIRSPGRWGRPRLTSAYVGRR